MSILIIVEHEQQRVNSSVRNAVTAAKAIGGEIHLLVAGESCEQVAAEAAAIDGVSQVRVATAAHYAAQLAEPLTELVLSIAKEYSHIVVAATSFGKNLLPRVAACLDVAMISDIESVVSSDTFVRPIYAGNALATVQSSDAIKVISVRGASFAAAEDAAASATIVPLAAATAPTVSRLVSRELTVQTRPSLSTAKVVVSGGRGLGSGEKFRELLEPLADKLGAAIGASRAAVDAGYVGNDFQVGQTGKIVAPKLYIAVGISGAIQHLAGMKDAKFIVAINKDAEAPIFQVADYGLVGDLFTVIPELTAQI